MYPDILSDERWSVWPAVSQDRYVVILSHQLTGNVSSDVNATYTYVNGIAVNETVRTMTAMDTGTGCFVQDSTSVTYTFRMFSYPDSVFGSTTLDVETTTVPVVGVAFTLI